MIGFGLSTLPLIKTLGVELGDAYQSWYADDAGIGGNFKLIRLFYERLVELGSPLGYTPEASKRKLITCDKNMKRAEEYFADMKFQIYMGHRYLGGFLGCDEDRQDWVLKKVKEWGDMINKMSNIAS